MNDQIAHKEVATIPDYQSAIYQILLRIERLLEAGVVRSASLADNGKSTMSINEAARYLGIGRSKLYELVRTQQITSIRVGRRILVPTRQLDAFIHDS